MSSQFSPPVGMSHQWAPHGPFQYDAPRGPFQHNQMEQGYGWNGQPAHGTNSGAHVRNQHNSNGWQGHQPRYGHGQNSSHNYNHYNNNGSTSYNKYNHYNNQGSRPKLSCEPCGKTFGSTEILKEHLEEHVQCPFPECRMNACIKVMDQHITNQHILVNFADLQIDNEQWIEQRKKRFPTAERAKIRREQQMEMIRRGQKIGLEKQGLKKNNKYDKQKKYENKPANNDQRKSNEIDENKEKTFNGKKRESFRERRERIKNEKREKFLKREEENNKLSKSFIDVDVYDSDSEVKYGLPAFKGTKLFYEEIGLTSYITNTKNENLSEEDHNIAISDDEEWNITEINGNNENNDYNKGIIASPNSNATSGSSKLVLGNALGSLIGAYDSDSEENEENKQDLPQLEIKNKEIETTKEVHKNVIADVNEERENNSDPKSHLEQETENTDGIGAKRRRNRKHRRNRHKGDVIATKDEGESGKVNQKQHAKPKRPPHVKRRRPTLLMRLLEADIRHERNIILQCIRHIVGNNFFEEVVESESDEEPTENEQQGEDMNINNTVTNGEKENVTVSNDDLQNPTKSATKRKSDNPVKSKKAKEAKLLDALTKFHEKNFDRVARNMFADDDEDGVTSVEDYLNMKK